MIKNVQRGFTIIEMIIAMVIISVILLVVIPIGQTAMDNSRIANAIASLKAIQTAAVGWSNDLGGGVYTGISFGALSPSTGTQYLPASFSPTGTDPWNGNYTISVNPSNSEMVDIGLTNVPAGPAAILSTKLAKISSAASGPSYSSSTQTWTITLQ